MLIIASAISIVIIARVVPVSWKRTPFARFALLILLILPFVHLKVRSAGFYLWPYDRYIRYPQSRPWRLTPGLAEDIAKMKQHVRPMENIYVLPPRQNDLHFFLGTRYEQYGWGTPIALNDVLAGAGLEGVLIVNVDSLPDYVALASKRAFDYDDAEQILTEHSYRLVVKLPTMSLWRK